VKTRVPELLSGLGAAILDALPLGLYAVDRDLTVTAWNRRREEGPLGQPRQQVLGRHLREILTPAGYAATEPVLRRVFETGQPHQETTETRMGTALYRSVRVPVMQDGRVTQVLSLFEDVTEQRALEMRVIASDRLAFLGQLVAGVAHEVSNPLAGIAGCTEALAALALSARGAAQQREAREFRDLVRGEVARCERIVRTLLDSARPQGGERCSVPEVVGAVLRLLDHHPDFTRVQVESKMPKGLPPAQIDADSLKQVVIALATNAGRAMKGRGTLTLRAGRRGRFVTLDVTDTGPGVPTHVLPHVFEPFFTTDPEQGSGLGLAIARSLVRGRGGDLVYRHRRGKGAWFRATLRAARANA
jgi:PAS domain S-box-containing protein